MTLPSHTEREGGEKEREPLRERFRAILDTLSRHYNDGHAYPWVVAYSGGKDSTLLLHLVWEMVLGLAPDKRKRSIYIVSNDTLVESPPVIEHLHASLAVIKKGAEQHGLPMHIKVTEPDIDQTFWVNVIGRGYIPPTRNFRWCTDRMKIRPTTRLLKKLTTRHQHSVLLIGTRRHESQNRARNMERRGVRADMTNEHDNVEGCFVFAPLADLSDDDVWTILMQRPPPWGGSHRPLITLYRNAKGGDCPLVLSEDDAPSCGTTSPRFGCWTCTVVQKDRSLLGFIESSAEDEDKLEAMADFRDWLIKLREDDNNRSPMRRNGETKFRADGRHVRGPFTIEVRQRILARLEQLERDLGEQFMHPIEKDMIQDIWRDDRALETMRTSLSQRHR